MHYVDVVFLSLSLSCAVILFVLKTLFDAVSSSH